MSFEPVLNELSLDYPAPDIAEARRRMTRFIHMLTTATDEKGPYKLRRTLRVKDDAINSLELAPGYPLAQWRNDNQVPREEKAFFRILQTKSPFLVEHSDKEDTALGIECFWNGKPAEGFRAALLLDTLSLSIPSDPVWNTSQVLVSVKELDTGGKIFERDEPLPHAARIGHLKELAPWIEQCHQARKKLAQQTMGNGSDLWKARATLFPFLEFCHPVEDQLITHAPNGTILKAIVVRLSNLNHSSEHWLEWKGRFTVEQLPGNASPESEPTLQNPDFRKQREFLCPDGQYRLFSWHIKMGNGWRIHFYPDEEQKRIIVGYIGPHLPTVKYH